MIILKLWFTILIISVFLGLPSLIVCGSSNPRGRTLKITVALATLMVWIVGITLVGVFAYEMFYIIREIWSF